MAILRTNKRDEKGIREKGEEIKVRKGYNGLTFRRLMSTTVDVPHR